MIRGSAEQFNIEWVSAKLSDTCPRYYEYSKSYHDAQTGEKVWQYCVLLPILDKSGRLVFYVKPDPDDDNRMMLGGQSRKFKARADQKDAIYQLNKDADMAIFHYEGIKIKKR